MKKKRGCNMATFISIGNQNHKCGFNFVLINFLIVRVYLIGYNKTPAFFQILHNIFQMFYLNIWQTFILCFTITP